MREGLTQSSRDRPARSAYAETMNTSENPPAEHAPDQASAARRCPCGGGDVYGACCGRLHGRFAADGTLAAPTAEALMRSRYSAFAVRDSEYLLRTWHRSTRPASLELDPRQHWIDLTILARTGGGLLESRGTVEFVASYRAGGKVHRHHEHSRFVREKGRWLYVGTV